MKDEAFEELLESVRQAGAIRRGESQAGRVFEAETDTVDAKSVRESLGLSQSGFAALLGISAGTLRNWEQGRRSPEGAAKVLLRVAARHPEVILEVVRPAAKPRGRPSAKPRAVRLSKAF